jgi:hypothetical protein
MQGVREKHSGEYTFKASEPYQAVYRTVLHQARECFATGMITAQMVVDGDLYTDIKSGNVSVALHGGAGVDTYLVIDIKESTSTSSSVTVYNSLSTWERPARAVESWVLHGATECKAAKS